MADLDRLKTRQIKIEEAIVADSFVLDLVI
jgi:hypothetical protein